MSMKDAARAGNPRRDDERDPAGVVKDALEQYPDLPDHEIVRAGGPEDYILQRLHEAGWRIVRYGPGALQQTEWAP